MGWLAGWSYRKALNVKGEAGAGTAYQVKIKVEKALTNGEKFDDAIHRDEGVILQASDLSRVGITNVGPLVILRDPETCEPVQWNSKYWGVVLNVTNGPDTGQFDVVSSVNLTSWTEEYTDIIDPVGGTWEHKIYYPSSLIYISGDASPFVLFYGGIDNGGRRRAGAARSSDMQNWTKNINNPLFSYQNASWAKDGIEALAGVTKMSGSAAHKWVAVFEGEDGNSARIGVAYNDDNDPDTTSWTFSNRIFTGLPAGFTREVDPWLIRIGSYYIIYYELYDGASWTIGGMYAHENDVFTADTGWTRYSRMPISHAGTGGVYSVYKDGLIWVTVAGTADNKVHLMKVYPISIEANAKSDWGDIRFTASDGTTELSYWMREKTDNDYAVFWVKVTANLDSNATIYVYYGNNAVSTTSNFDNTFIFGDPWDNVVLDATRWTSVDGNPTYSIDPTNHYLEITDKDEDGWTAGFGFHSKTTLSFPAQWICESAYEDGIEDYEEGFILYVHQFINNDVDSIIFSIHHAGWGFCDAPADGGIAFYESGDGWNANMNLSNRAGVGGNCDWTSGPFLPSYPVEFKITMYKLSGDITVEEDNTKRIDAEANAETPDRVHIGLVRATGRSFGTKRVYAFIIRKYNDPEPTFLSFGAEESFTPKQHNWRWYEDDGAEPTTPLTNENTQGNGWQRETKIRLRVCIHETGGVGDTNQDFDVEYSHNQSDWYPLGTQGAVDQKFRYANGQATNGNALAGGKISCQDELGKYHEQSCVNCEDIGANKHHEVDVCIENYNGDHNQVYYFRIKLEGTALELDGASTYPQFLTSPAFTPKQCNWRWYENDGVEPTNPLANENVGPTGIQRGTLLRLRICIHETAGSPYGSNQDIQVQWSTDDISFTTIGAQGAVTQPWRWANGQATDLGNIPANKLSCGTATGKYHEQACNNCENIGSGAHHEIDICIENYSGVGNTGYTFRILLEGSILVLDGGKSHPSLTTNPRYTLSVQSIPVNGFSFTWDGTPQSTPQTQEVEGGTTITLVVTTPQTVGGQKYRFQHWEDMSGNPTRNVTVNANTTVTITMIERYIVTVNSNPIAGFIFTFNGTSRTSNYSEEVDNGTVVTLIVSTPQIVGGTIYTFSQWENGSGNPTRNVTVNSDKTVTFTMQLPTTEEADTGGIGSALTMVS